MRFIVSIHNGPACIARASSTDAEGASPEAAADEARAALLRDVKRGRSDALTDSALEGIADGFHGAVLQHAASRLSGSFSCVARRNADGTHSVTTQPGEWAMLTQRGDIVAAIRIQSDEEVARNDAFVDGLLKRA